MIVNIARASLVPASEYKSETNNALSSDACAFSTLPPFGVPQEDARFVVEHLQREITVYRLQMENTQHFRMSVDQRALAQKTIERLQHQINELCHAYDIV